MEGEWEQLKREEAMEIARHAELDGALASIKAKNEEILKEIAQAERELASLNSEYATLCSLKGITQEQLFNVKAKSYKNKSEVLSLKQSLQGNQRTMSTLNSMHASQAEVAKALEENIAALFVSPWVADMSKAKHEVDQLREEVKLKEKELTDLQNAKKFPSPNVDVERFRMMVRKELRLNENRGTEETSPSMVQQQPLATPSPNARPMPQQQPFATPSPSPRPMAQQPFATPSPRPMAQQQQQPFATPSPSPRPMPQQPVLCPSPNSRPTPEQQHLLAAPSPVKATPPTARPKPIQNYGPRDEEHLFRMPVNFENEDVGGSGDTSNPEAGLGDVTVNDEAEMNMTLNGGGNEDPDEFGLFGGGSSNTNTGGRNEGAHDFGLFGGANNTTNAGGNEDLDDFGLFGGSGGNNAGLDMSVNGGGEGGLHDFDIFGGGGANNTNNAGGTGALFSFMDQQTFQSSNGNGNVLFGFGSPKQDKLDESNNFLF